MPTSITAMAAKQPGGPLEKFSYDPGPLGPQQVEIAVKACGICHSDLSLIHNEWGISQFPLVPGHEVIGQIVAVGDQVQRSSVGQTVGLGWFSQSCLHCQQCLSGDHNLCTTAEQTIVGRHGGFATRVRADALWAIPLPEGLDPLAAGPLYCGGVTVFNPLVQFDVRPTHHVGVVGIGGLGHMALQFLNKWGCEVTAFTSPDKQQEAKALGAHHAVNSRDPKTFRSLAGQLDLILVAVNVPLDWQAYITCLAPKGRLHFVGAVTEPVPVAVFPLLLGQKQVSGSPLGSPQTTANMLRFAARHQIAPKIEVFPLSKVNEALARSKSGQARYRVVLENDLGN